MQQNCSFASHFCTLEVSNSTLSLEDSQFNLEPEPHPLTDEACHKPYYKNAISTTLLGLVVSLGTTGAFLMFGSQPVEAAVNLANSNVSSNPKQATDLTVTNTVSSVQIPLKTQIIELPKLSLQPTASTPASLSSTIVSPLSPQKQLTTNSSPQNSVNSNATSQLQATVPIRDSRNIPELPALNSQSTNAKQIYTVKPGDTLVKIANLYQTSWEQLIKTNQISNPNFLSIDQKLVIPTIEIAQAFDRNSNATSLNLDRKRANNSVERSKPDNSSNTEALYVNRLRADLDRLREQYQDGSANDRIELNSATLVSHPQNNYISTGPTNITNYNQTLRLKIGANINPALPPLSSPEQYLPDSPTKFNGYLWPAQGALTSGYGMRWGRMHRGIDIAAPIGTPVIAAAAGEVVSAGWNSGGYGNLVELKHSDGSVTLYAHNNKLLVSSGQEVKQGQLIAEMGTTGYSTGPHLHFEVHPNGQTAVNPIAYLPSK